MGRRPTKLWRFFSWLLSEDHFPPLARALARLSNVEVQLEVALCLPCLSLLYGLFGTLGPMPPHPHLQISGFSYAPSPSGSW